jgi:hypothetical protein
MGYEESSVLEVVGENMVVAVKSQLYLSMRIRTMR